MDNSRLFELGNHFTILFIQLMLLGALAILLFWFFGWFFTHARSSRSPYSGEKMQPAENLAYESVARLENFLDTIHSPENPKIDLSRACVCKKTGRIFPEAIDSLELIQVPRKFLEKRHPGTYTSWGSLKPQVREHIQAQHNNLEGYQLEHSPSHSNPWKVSWHQARLKPGPLYVDLYTLNLLGWMTVPGTSLEILVVKKPLAHKDSQ